MAELKEKPAFRNFDTYGWNSATPEGAEIPEMVESTPYSPDSQNIKSMLITLFCGSERKETLVWIDRHTFHNCKCHKLAAITFYQYTPEGKYVQVPLHDGLPETKMIVLGEVNEIRIYKDQEKE